MIEREGLEVLVKLRLAVPAPSGAMVMSPSEANGVWMVMAWPSMAKVPLSALILGAGAARLRWPSLSRTGMVLAVACS